jgi:hypothetical protein
VASRGKRTRTSDADLAVYRIQTDRGYARRNTPEVRQALQAFVDALNALPSPFEACIADITVEDLSLALKSLDLHQRMLFFRAIGKNLQPRGAVPKAMCVDALGQLKKLTGGTARRALYALANDVQSTLKAQVYPDTHNSAAAPPLLHWSEALLRTGIWAFVEGSVMDSRGIVWAAQQKWLMPSGFSMDDVAPVVKAAQDIVDLTPDYTPVPLRGTEAGAEEVVRPEPGAVKTIEPTERSEAEALGHLEDANPNSGADAETTVFEGATTQSLATVETLEEDVARTRSILSTVRSEALERIASELDREAPPGRADIMALSDLANAFDQITAALKSAPGALVDTSSPIRSLDDCEAAIARLRASQTRATMLEPIKRLRDAEYIGGANAAIAGALTALRSRASDLISSDDPDTTEVEALRDLVELIDAHSAQDAAAPQRMLTLQQDVVTVYPEHAALVMAAVMGQLVWKTRPQEASQKAAKAKPGMVGGNSGNGEVPRIAPETEPMTGRTVTATQAVTDVSTSHPGIEPPPPLAEAGQLPEPAQVDRSAVDEINEPAAMNPTEVSDAEVALAELIGQQRYSAALAVATAHGASPAHLSALRLAGLAAAARADTGVVAARIRAELTAFAANPSQFQNDDDTLAVLLAVPALVRIAFVVGEPAAGPLLQEVRASVVSPLGKIIEDIAQHSVRNLFASGALRPVRADAKTLNEQAAAARQAAEALRSRPRNLRWKRATDVASNWLSPTGMLGSLLKIVAEDRRADVAFIAAEVMRLANNAEIEREISSAEKRFRRNVRRPLEGAARRTLAELVEETLTPLSDWAQAGLALHRESGGSSTERWTSTELANLRATIKSKRDSVSASIASTYAQQVPQTAAAAHAALASLNESFDFAVSGTGMDGPEPAVELAAELEFLRVPGVAVDETAGEVTLPSGIAAVDIAHAMRVPWGEVFAGHLESENFPAATALNTSRGHLHGAMDGLSEQALENAIRASRNELNAKHDELSADLRRARRQNELSEEQDADLSEKLSAHDPHDDVRIDLLTIRQQLDTVAKELPSYREEAITRLRARFDKIASPSQADGDTITNLLDQGELSVAEELINFLEAGESLPKHRVRTDFADFFPSVPTALTSGLTKRLITAVSNGRRVPDTPLDFSTLSAEARAITADALKNWSTISAATPERRHKLTENAAVELKPIMRILGYEFQSAHRLSLSRGADYRFLELTDVRVTGRALVPTFGSHLGGRLRVMLVWSKPGPEQFMSWADHDARNGSLVVLHFGTLSVRDRRNLASRAVQTSAPVVVIDDAALAYLAASGEGQLDATMSISLPFAAVNPYTNVRRGLVAPEMFYGRNQERRDVLDPQSSQVLYGGRGLGKSALLRASAERFETADHRRIAIYLDLNTIGFGAGQPATVVWDALLQCLRDREILPPRGKRRQADSYKVVATGISEWLRTHSQNELLVLLDEADRFFNEDASVFRETSRLKALSGVDGAANRVKVVFAGLHTVQRFAKASTNGPFSHLGAPVVIGQLSPQSAYDLVATPMGALGFEFEDTDLINGILAYCSYQPFLLQMFCHRLVRVMLDRRAQHVEKSEPPYLITRADIDAIERDAELQERIEAAFTDTLHLDARYNVIACVIAHNAHANGLDARLTDLELRRDCAAYWEEGFAEVDAERFRAYLEEMVGLGVLAPRNARGWRLRSPNTLRRIGNENAVLEKLVTAAEESVPEDFITLESRQPLADGKPSPLTAAQLVDLLGNHRNQTRLIIGSPATGLAFVPAAIRTACTNFGGTITLIEPSSNKEFRDALRTGQPGERRVIFSDLRNTSEPSCRDSVRQAISQLPTTQGVTRSVVLVASPEQLDWWADEVMRHDDELGTVTLNRHTPLTLKVWALNNDKFASSDRLEQLFGVTGGWPSLVSKAAELAASQNENRALKALEAWVNSPEGANEFVESTGIDSDPELAAAFDELGALVTEPVSIDDMLEAIKMAEHPDPEKAYAVLNTLGAFNAVKGLVVPDTLLVSLRHLGPPRRRQHQPHPPQARSLKLDTNAKNSQT